MTGAEVRIDWRKVQDIARRHWGVHWPIKGRRRTRRIDPRTGLATVRKNRAGRHAVRGNREEGYVHDIQLTNDWRLDEMLKTLAHELEHARQCESLGVDTMSMMYSNFGPAHARLGHTRRRDAVRHEEGFEMHARLAEDRWELLLPATRRRETHP